MYTDFNNAVRTRNLWRIQRILRLPPHLYSVTQPPANWLVRLCIITVTYHAPVTVLGKIFGGGGGPLSFGRQQRLSDITIEPLKNLGAWTRLGGCAPGPNLESPLSRTLNLKEVNYGVWNRLLHDLMEITSPPLFLVGNH